MTTPDQFPINKLIKAQLLTTKLIAMQVAPEPILSLLPLPSYY